MSKSTGYRGQRTRVKTGKMKKPSSQKWLLRQLNDTFVAKAKIDGYRSRAAYKLIEINDKFGLLKKGMNVIDLGAAPGGWSEVAARLIGSDNVEAKNKLLAIDLLAMDDLPGVVFYQKNFFDEDIKDLIRTNLDGNLVEVVLSDMAANTTGHRSTDNLRTVMLCEAAFDFALQIVKPGGHFVAKIFRGGAENDLLAKARQHFKRVKHFKPQASRKESSEFYLIAMDKREVGTVNKLL